MHNDNDLSIAVSGTDVYVSGTLTTAAENSKALLWKNGNSGILPAPADRKVQGNYIVLNGNIFGNVDSKNLPSQSDINMVNNALSDVVSRVDIGGFDMKSDLLNGQVSSYFNDMYESQGTSEQITLNSNKGSGFGVGDNAPAQSDEQADGTTRVTYNMASKFISGKTDGVVQGTVENVQNTYVHEIQGHRLSKAPREGSGHAKAYEAQMSHSTFKNTTAAFQAAIKEMYNSLKK